MIKIEVPGELRYRDVAVRAVRAACKLMGPREPRVARQAFVLEVISAFGEAFNNICLHGYRGRRRPGAIRIEIEVRDDRFVLRLFDFGVSFDPRTVPPPTLGALRESGAGAFIIRSFVDKIAYEAGRPNVLEATKYLGATRMSPREKRGRVRAVS